MSHSHAEVIHFVTTFYPEKWIIHHSPHSPLPAPLLPLGCVIGRTLWVSYGAGNTLSGCHCQRVEISLSLGSGHNTPLFTLKPSLNSPTPYKQLKRNLCVWTVLIAPVRVTGWQVIRHDRLTGSPSVCVRTFPSRSYWCRSKLCNCTLCHNKGLDQPWGDKPHNNNNKR